MATSSSVTPLPDKQKRKRRTPLLAREPAGLAAIVASIAAALRAPPRNLIDKPNN